MDDLGKDTHIPHMLFTERHKHNGETRERERLTTVANELTHKSTDTKIHGNSSRSILLNASLVSVTVTLLDYHGSN